MVARSSRPVRLAVLGAGGRMGARIIALAEADPRFLVAAGVERPGHPLIGRFLGDGRAPVVSELGEVAQKTDVVVDFTHPRVTLATARRMPRTKAALVVGTTGLSTRDVLELKKISRRVPVVYSPNMSVGMNVLFRLVEKAAQALSSYDIEVVEAHHNQKKDAPSGSALRLAQGAAVATGRTERDLVYGRHGVTGARGRREIGVHAVRAGDIVGDHTVYFGGPAERLELVHRAHSRDVFAAGALTAAAWVARRRPGFYSMFDVLSL